MCSTCATLRDQDALTLAGVEIVEINRNACAPVTYYTIRCKTCDTRWDVIEVYDEVSDRPSEWSWTRANPH